MAEPPTNILTEDLEDGEIESEGEDVPEIPKDSKIDEHNTNNEIKQDLDKIEHQPFYYSKSGKKKRSKLHKSEQKFKKNRKYASPVDDDFAGNIEKAIRKAMNKNDNDEQMEDDVEDRRKYKKRKKNDSKDGPSRKRKKQDYSEEMDENEMMCIRGASPVQRNSPNEGYQDNDSSYASDSSQGSRELTQHRSARQRPPQRERNKNSKNDRRRATHPIQDSDGVCLYYMQGKCHKGDDCIYSHDAQPPRKMELCKFYLMDCCAKRDKCLYMHADFPCKYYHTGLPCVYKDDCKFAHGKHLNDSLKNILLKHIESAPKEILGDFPRLNRDGALKMIQTTQLKLMQQFSESTECQERSIPSLFELNIPNPQNSPDNFQMNQYSNQREKVSPKVRQSRWQNEGSNTNFGMNMSPNGNTSSSNVLNIKNLTGVLTAKQISDLTKMGIENLDQLGQLTVLQLNSIGISLKQITDIQLNTMSIQKLGLINSVDQQPQTFVTPTSGAQDMDLRVPPGVSVTSNVSLPSELPGHDIDMRFQPSVSLSKVEEPVGPTVQKNVQCNKDMIDIDQYTKDALKFAMKDKENIDISNESFEHDKCALQTESKDVDHRVLPFAGDDSITQHTKIDDKPIQAECDTDIRFLQPEPLFKNSEKRHRRSTTDDEDNNLLIDEKWYSSDEEKGNKRKSPASSPKKYLMSPPTPSPHVIEPSAVLSRLGDLSKIDISVEVTKLLNTMKNNLQDNKKPDVPETRTSRDPRSRRSPDRLNDSFKTSKKTSRVTIYECIDGEPTDGRRRTDVDLRHAEYKIPSFGDTDLRQNASGDIDFRLGLPFKPIPNYTPASEINASINNHPPITYKLIPIDIPRPDYTDIKNSTAKSQALVDPRLRKVFRLSVEESNSDSEKNAKATNTVPRVDPRRKPKETETLEQKPNNLDLQTVLQNSNWYKDLSSTQKIFVNQNLAPVTQMIKQYQQEKSSGKKFDFSSFQSNTVLCNIFTNLGITLGENGEYSYLPKPKEALLKTPTNFNQNTIPFNMNAPGAMEANMNMLNIPPMGIGSVANMNNLNVGHMHNFNQPLPDPRGGPTPGLLGIAPNIPHNFNNNNYGGASNYGNMPFNGPPSVNDFNYMDGEQNFQRFPNRGSHRGRGNDRWNRGGSGRGHRDRKNFNERSNWKNDRH